jgi:hypothetical protein
MTVEAEEDMLCQSEDVDTLMEGAPSPGHWPLIMLYRFDPLLLGYRDRGWIVDDEYRSLVSRPAGHIEGVVLGPRDGKACATWRYARSSSGLTIEVKPFRPLAPGIKREIKLRAKGLQGYFGVPLKGVAFSPPAT